MTTSIGTTLPEALRQLPEDAAARAVVLQRLADTCAAGEAIAALRAAAGHASVPSGALRDVLASAAALWDGRGFTELIDDAAMRARRRLHEGVASPEFLAMLPAWVVELRQIASLRPGTGACTTATGIQLWTWTMHHLQQASPRREAAIGELADAFCWLLAARCQILQLEVLAAPGPGATASFSADLCHTTAARAAGLVGAVCAELVYGYRRHLAWDAEGCASCYGAEDLDEMEGLIPGIASSARAHGDVVEADGSHPLKAGPCAHFTGVEEFARLRTRLDGCLTGSRLARDRAAAALPTALGAATLNT